MTSPIDFKPVATTDIDRVVSPTTMLRIATSAQEHGEPAAIRHGVVGLGASSPSLGAPPPGGAACGALGVDLDLDEGRLVQVDVD